MSAEKQNAAFTPQQNQIEVYRQSKTAAATIAAAVLNSAIFFIEFGTLRGTLTPFSVKIISSFREKIKSNKPFF